MGRMLPPLALSILLAVPRFAPPAEREGPPPESYRLDWRAPASCPSLAQIEARIAALRSGPANGERTLDIEVTVTPTAAGMTARLQTRFEGRQDTRELLAARCEDVAEALAVFVVVSLEPAPAGDPGLPPDAGIPDPRVSPHPGASPGSDAGVPDPRALPPPDARRGSVGASVARSAVPTRASPHVPSTATGMRTVTDPSNIVEVRRDASSGGRRFPRHGHLGVHAGPEIGVLSAPTAVARLSLAMAWIHLRLEVVGTYFTPRLLLEDTGGGGLYQAGSVAPRVCWQSRPVGLAWFGCGGFEAGVLRVDARRTIEPNTVHGVFGGPLGAVGLLRYGVRTGFVLGLEAAGRAFGAATVLGSARARMQFPVSVRGFVGFEIRLP